MMVFHAKSSILILFFSLAMLVEHCNSSTVSQLFSLVRSGKFCSKIKERHGKRTLVNFCLFKGVPSLKSGIISELTVKDQLECGHHCAMKKFCAGFNFKQETKKNKINCQLTNSKDHKFEENTSAEEADWDFYEAVGGKKVGLI